MNRKFTFEICVPIALISFTFFLIFCPFFIKIGFCFPIHSISDYGHSAFLFSEQIGYESIVRYTVRDGFSFDNGIESQKWFDKSINSFSPLFSTIPKYMSNKNYHSGENGYDSDNFYTAKIVKKSDDRITNNHGLNNDDLIIICGLICLYTVLMSPSGMVEIPRL